LAWSVETTSYDFSSSEVHNEFGVQNKAKVLKSVDRWSLARWAYHAKNSYTLLKYLSPSIPHFWKLWQLRQNGRGAVAAVSTALPSSTFWSFTRAWTLNTIIGYKLAPQPDTPESRGRKSGSHSRDGTTTILLSKFSKMRCTMLGDNYFFWMNILAGCTRQKSFLFEQAII